MELTWIGWDKLVHCGMYGGLSFLMLLAFQKKMNQSKTRMYVFVILVGIVVGYALELCQLFLTESRQFDFADLIANITGTIFGAILFYWIGRKFNKIVT